MLRRVLVLALVFLGLASVATARTVDKVTFTKVTITAKSKGNGGVDINVTVACSGAKHFSAHVWLASTEGSNKTFWDKTLTGAVNKNKGAANITYGRAVPATGFVLVGSNVFCWDKDKSQGVGYRDFFYAQCAPTGRCVATASPRP